MVEGVITSWEAAGCDCIYGLTGRICYLVSATQNQRSAHPKVIVLTNESNTGHFTLDSPWIMEYNVNTDNLNSCLYRIL